MRTAIAVVVLAIAVSGCLGPTGAVGTEAPGQSPTSTPTATSATAGTSTPTGTMSASPTTAATSASTSTPTPTAPPTVTPGELSEMTVDYDDLGPHEQAAFDAALDGEVTFAPESPYVETRFHTEDAVVFRQYKYVRKDETYYRLTMSFGRLYAEYGIEATRAPEYDDSSVVSVENLSTDVRDEVRWAVENGSHHVPVGKWYSLPEELSETEYVRYQGETYRLGYVVGDYWAETLTAERDPTPTVVASPTPTERPA